MQNKKGISLIVLVITIIVMIILAAAIIISLNNTGIISNANTAKTKTDDKQIREAIEVAKLNLNFEGGINESNLQNELQKSLGVDVEVINNMDKSYTIKVKDMYYTLEEDETVVSGMYNKWDKTSTEPTQKTNEIHIYKASELKWIQEEVEKGNTFENYKIYLENNLDFGARENEGTTLDEKWKTTSNKEYKWTPIGKETEKELKAEFDGKNHIIKGIYVEETTKFNGIFGRMDNTVCNLTIKNSYIEGISCTAGIIGRGGANCDVVNCHNINTTVLLITGEYNTVAGIIGQTAGDITNCTNSGTIIANGISKTASIYNIKFGDTKCGGIAASVVGTSKVTNCTNTGKIVASGSIVGGIVGNLKKNSNSSISNCINIGSVSTEGGFIGGIIGNMGYNTSVSECINKGQVSAKKIELLNNYSFAGGIVGNAATGSSVINCCNMTTISSTGQYTGGIVGRISSYKDIETSSILRNCINLGNVKGEIAVGGIVGDVNGQKQKMSLCYNKAQVSGTSSVGSIIGDCDILNNDLNHLYYLNTLNLKAINNTDYEDKNITSTTKNINSFEEFKTWISQFK